MDYGRSYHKSAYLVVWFVVVSLDQLSESSQKNHNSPRGEGSGESPLQLHEPQE